MFSHRLHHELTQGVHYKIDLLLTKYIKEPISFLYNVWSIVFELEVVTLFILVIIVGKYICISSSETSSESQVHIYRTEEKYPLVSTKIPNLINNASCQFHSSQPQLIYILFAPCNEVLWTSRKHFIYILQQQQQQKHIKPNKYII